MRHPDGPSYRGGHRRAGHGHYYVGLHQDARLPFVHGAGMVLVADPVGWSLLGREAIVRADVSIDPTIGAYEGRHLH